MLFNINFQADSGPSIKLIHVLSAAIVLNVNTENGKRIMMDIRLSLRARIILYGQTTFGLYHPCHARTDCNVYDRAVP